MAIFATLWGNESWLRLMIPWFLQEKPNLGSAWSIMKECQIIYLSPPSPPAAPPPTTHLTDKNLKHYKRFSENCHEESFRVLKFDSFWLNGDFSTTAFFKNVLPSRLQCFLSILNRCRSATSINALIRRLMQHASSMAMNRRYENTAHCTTPSFGIQRPPRLRAFRYEPNLL